MPLVSEVDGLQDAIRMILLQLLSGNSLSSKPRGLPTHELLGAAIKITNPRNRLVFRPPKKKWSLAFAMGEYLWYMRGENSVEAMAYYAPSIRAFSDDGLTLNSAYGHRIFGNHAQIGFDQWQAAKARLTEDPESRQAVIHIRTACDSLINTRDHPCTIALHFIQRGGLLNLIATMRSNDIIFGTPYDIFSFTMMQEQMAFELELDMGSYFHQVGSWHLYSAQRQLAEEMAELADTPPPMPALEPGIHQMIRDEESIRRGQHVEPGAGYWRDWRLTLLAFAGLIKEPPDLQSPYQQAWEAGQRHQPRFGSVRRQLGE